MLYAAHCVVQVVEVKLTAQVCTGQRALSCSRVDAAAKAAVSTIAPAEDHGEQDDRPPAVTIEKSTVVTVAGIAAESITGCKIVIHFLFSFSCIYIGAARSPNVLG